MSGPKPIERCFIHYESVESLTELVQLCDLESWKNQRLCTFNWDIYRGR